MGRAPFHNPFRGLRARPAPASPPARQPPPSPAPVAEDPDAVFVRAVQDARPLHADAHRMRAPPVPPPAAPGPMVDPDADALAALADLVAGRGALEPWDGDEYLEGVVEPGAARVLERLKRGELSVQAHLDLHGATVADARPMVEGFLRRSRELGLRCVVIIHGRGLHSKDREPVLKERVVAWLSRGALAREVLCFCTARPRDGGAGALYVALARARRPRAPSGR